MSGPDLQSRWLALSARVLGRPASEVMRQARTTSFVGLGGTSLRAAELLLLAQRDLAETVPLSTLLSAEPLLAVLRSCSPAAPATDDRGAAATSRSSYHRISPGQVAMLAGEEIHGGTAFHLLFSADINGVVLIPQLLRCLDQLVRSHEALRTIFEPTGTGFLARVALPGRVPAEVLSLAVPSGETGISEIHGMVASASQIYLRPTAAPPVRFFLTSVSPTRTVLTMLIHHALVDGWSIGLIWAEIFRRYQGDAPPCDPAVGESPPAWPTDRPALDARTRALHDVEPVELPTDLDRPPVSNRGGRRLLIELTGHQAAAVTEVAWSCGVSRNAVLLGLWSLAIMRYADADRILMGVSAANRPGQRHQHAVGYFVNLLPVLVDRTGTDCVRSYLRRVATELGAALDAQAVPFENLVTELKAGGEPDRNPLVQFGFAAHDELVPSKMQSGELDVSLHEGHCGGTIFDAFLYVQRWPAGSADGPARLALEYATSVIEPGMAAELAGDLRALVETAAADADAPLWRLAMGISAVFPTPAAREFSATDRSLWSLIEESCHRHWAEVAIRSGRPTQELTYRQLLGAVETQSAALTRVGVRPGDHVLVSAQRSAAEVVAVLAAIRVGAAYIGVDPGYPGDLLQHLIRVSSPAAAVIPGNAALAASLQTQPGAPILVPTIDPWAERRAVPAPAAAPADPDRVTCVAFTSGSTGLAKGARIPEAGVIRLTWRPNFIRATAMRHFLRLAPLTFDASTLEILAPLLAGGCIEVYPEGPVDPSELGTFIRDRSITGAWLTAGLFRVLADHRPAVFAGLSQVLTGGDVVPPAQVRRVLATCPGLRVTNGYGPTENTTFSTVFHMDDPSHVTDSVPIGRPIPGTTLSLRARDGSESPPGGAGEIWVSGAGVALGYLGEPATTIQAFIADNAGERWYRTGDLARWNRAGELLFLGRRDRQLKISGRRIEPTGIEQALRQCAGVRDAIVMVEAAPGPDRRLSCAVILDGKASLTHLREQAASRLPTYALPTHWYAVAAFPLNPNGKVDMDALAAMGEAAVGGGEAAPGMSRTLSHPELIDVVAKVWQHVIGHHEFSYDQPFFDAGGDSGQLLQVRDALLTALPDCRISVLDLMQQPTVSQLATYLESARAEAQ